jgi:hypothetical protein
VKGRGSTTPASQPSMHHHAPTALPRGLRDLKPALHYIQSESNKLQVEGHRHRALRWVLLQAAPLFETMRQVGEMMMTGGDTRGGGGAAKGKKERKGGREAGRGDGAG